MKHLSFARKLSLIWKALMDRRTPLPAKIIVILGILYVASPLDIIPDILPVLGWTDDLGIIVAALAAFLRIASRVMESMDKEEHDKGIIDVEVMETRRGHR